MDTKLNEFNSWLTENCSNYISMIGEGSVATDDYWIENRSDYDIFVIFDGDYRKEFNKVHNYLISSNFDDNYKFSVYALKDYLKSTNCPKDFSSKFRSKVLFGKDIIENKSIPSHEMTFEMFLDGLKNTVLDLESNILSSSFWGLRKVRDVFWELYKRTFMYLAIKIYYDTGTFPCSRGDVAKALSSNELRQTLNILNKIDSIEKEKIILNSENLFKYLKKLEVNK
jgi:hypothetical protein